MDDLLDMIAALDEFAFVPNHIADSFFASVYPTITSGKQTKVIIVSTPHGMNHFYRMWHDAEKGKTDIEIVEQDALIKKEIEDGIIPDPNAPVDPTTGMPLDQTSQMDLGQPVMEPDLKSQEKSVEMPPGGEI